jgi:hypothetical protein
MAALLAAILLIGAPARSAKKISRDPRTEGLGRTCRQTKDCRSKAQRCILRSDANGKQLKTGFCVLPCAPFEAGTAKVVPGEQIDPAKARKDLKKKAPPRCPARFECRTAGTGVPLDMCVKD